MSCSHPAPQRVIFGAVNELLSSRPRDAARLFLLALGSVAQFHWCVEDAPCLLLCLQRAESLGLQNVTCLQLFHLGAAG